MSRSRISAACEKLGPWELEALALIAERLLMGQREYGAYDPATDARQFDKEVCEELSDEAAYRAFGELKHRAVAAVLRRKL